MRDPKVKTSDMVRLVGLYALRYEKSGSELHSLKDALVKRGGLSDAEREVELIFNIILLIESLFFIYSLE